MDSEKWQRTKQAIEAEVEKVRRRLLLADNFDQMEEVAVEMGQVIERLALEGALEQREGAGARCCPDCGGRLRAEGSAKRQIKTRRGLLRYQRKRWVCEVCGATIFPPGSETGD